MELNTFGALLRFAMDLERQAGEFYRSLAAKVNDSASDLFSEYARQHTRRLKSLEEIRQRNINEVLLEPVSGIDSGSYAPIVGVNDKVDMKAALDAALDVEAKVQSFYRDSMRMAGAALGEAARAFLRLSEENVERRKALAQIRGTTANQWA